MFLWETVYNFYISSCLLSEVKYSLEYDRSYSGNLIKKFKKIIDCDKILEILNFNCSVYSKNYNVTRDFIGIL